MAETPENDAVAPEVDPEQIDAPAQDGTATEPQETKPEKTFSQKELDELIQKRLAKEQRKTEKQLAFYEAEIAKAKQPPPPEAAKPVRADFDDYEEYLDARAIHVARAERAREDAERSQQAAKWSQDAQQKEFDAKVSRIEEAGTAKYPDFKDALQNEIPLNNAMATAMVESDNGEDVVYYLLKNPKEAERIADLSPVQTAIAIGRLSRDIESGATKLKKISSAPAPIEPVSSKAIKTSSLPQDTDDVDTWMRKEKERIKNLRK